MSFIAIALTVLVALIAALHLYWALGGLWPGRDEADLSRTVVGLTFSSRMPPPRMMGTVALLLAGVAAWPLLIAPILRGLGPAQLATAFSILIAAIFLFRGLLGYSAAMQQRHAAEPFATYNRLYYSPLCLALGAGFFVFAFNGGVA